MPAKFLYCCSRISYFVHKHDHEFHILPTSLPAGYIEYFICLLPHLTLIFLAFFRLCKLRGYIENFICPLPRYNLICGVKTAHFSLYTLLPLKIFNFPLIFCSFCAIAGYFEVTLLYIPHCCSLYIEIIYINSRKNIRVRSPTSNLLLFVNPKIRILIKRHIPLSGIPIF